MKHKNPSKILIWAGVLMLATLLVIGCAKKPEPIVEPPGPTPEQIEQARQDSIMEVERIAAEREAAAEQARKEAEELARVEAEQAAKSSLQIVYFDYDRYNLRTDARQAGDFNSGVLGEYADWKILIEGHCDERGTDEYNLALGERRANAVKDFFINYGLVAERFSVVSYGEERPAIPGHNEEAWSKNRRAVLVIQ